MQRCPPPRRGKPLCGCNGATRSEKAADCTGRHQASRQDSGRRNSGPMKKSSPPMSGWNAVAQQSRAGKRPVPCPDCLPLAMRTASRAGRPRSARRESGVQRIVARSPRRDATRIALR